MKKDIAIIDWILILVLAILLFSNFVEIPFKKILQPIFMTLIFIHLAQHWKIVRMMFRNLFKKK